MKKIITSLGVLVVVAGAVVGATVAFFNDTETSSGNVLTAGKIDARVDSFGAIYNGEDVGNGSWPARDLTDEKFFTLVDLKPSDLFTRSISVHVDDNPAWLCLGAANLDDDENDVVEAEDDLGDTGPVGELSGNVHVLVWKEITPDLQHQSNEPILVDSFFDVFAGNLSALRDSGTSTPPITSIETELIAMSLCGGNHVIATPSKGYGGAVSCDGSTMNDLAQTDSLSADLVVYAEQSRNNPDFKCEDVGLD